MAKLIDYFARQGTFVNLITVFVFVVGIFAVIKIQREVFPNINFDTITVSTTFPGGSAESSERLITNPLEQDLKEVSGIKKMTSVSVEGQSVIVLQLDPDQTTAEEAEADIQDVVDATGDLPEGAEDPVVVVMESKHQPTIKISVGGDLAEEELRSAAKKLERIVERVPDVAKVNFDGLRDFEIRVEAIPKKLREYRISLQEIINALQRRNLNIPGGTLEAAASGDQHEMIIRTVGEYATAEDVANTVLRANALAAAIRIKHVAKVSKTFKKKAISYATNGKQAIVLTVMKKERADAIRLVDEVKAAVEAAKPTLKSGISIDYINDMSYFVRRRLKVLSNNLLVGLSLVLIVLSLVLPWKVAGITAFGIPFSFLGALAIFFFGDVSLNLISMMGLIIVVGMLVDDAVVVTENAQAHMELGLPPREAAIKGTQEIWAPVTASVLTTVMAFAPMMFMTGIFGKFIRYIPLGVIIALIVSLWECFFVLPHHIGAWVNKQKAKEGSNAGIFSRFWQNIVTPSYLGLLHYLLKLRYLVAIAMVAFVAGSLFLAVKKIGFVLFPPGAIDTFMIKAEAPVGTPMEKTARLLQPIENAVANLPRSEVQDYTTMIGMLRDESMGPTPSKRGGAYAQINVFLTAETERDRKAIDIIEELRTKVGTPPGLLRVSYERQRGGPPVGKPISIGIRGESYPEIMKAVARLKQELQHVKGVSDIEDSFITGKEEIHVRVKDAEVAAAGLSLREIGTVVRAAFEGIVPTSIKELDEEVDIRVTLQPRNRQDVNTLERLEIPNNRGNLIPLPRVAQMTKAEGIASYEHENNQRQVRITGEIDTKLNNARAVNSFMQGKIDELRPMFPGLSFHFGGEGQDTEESMQSLVEAFSFAFFGIFLLLILLFKNLYQPLIIATTIPLGIVSVIWTFFLHQKPLSFLAMIGVIALAGVIVNNAIVFVDFVNKARERGLNRIDSIKDSAKRRLRPIFLTTVTTVVGILPTAYGVGGLDPFVVPIALSLGWGMAFGSFLTTLILPPIMMIIEDLILGLRWVFTKLRFA